MQKGNNFWKFIAKRWLILNKFNVVFLEILLTWQRAWEKVKIIFFTISVLFCVGCGGEEKIKKLCIFFHENGNKNAMKVNLRVKFLYSIWLVRKTKRFLPFSFLLWNRMKEQRNNKIIKLLSVLPLITSSHLHRSLYSTSVLCCVYVCEIENDTSQSFLPLFTMFIIIIGVEPQYFTMHASSILSIIFRPGTTYFIIIQNVNYVYSKL